nr:hypothetical protein [Tanacetum cinerariifolium]
EDDIEEMDIKWNMALLSMRADRFRKKTGKKITIQGSDVPGFDKSKVECFNCHKMGHFARECRAHRSQDRGKRKSYKQGPKVEEPAPKALMAIDGIRWDWSYMANEEENHALVADDEVPTKFAIMPSQTQVQIMRGLSQVEARLVEFKENEVKFYKRIRVLERDVEIRDNKIEYLKNELEQNKEGLGYSAVPPPPAQIYSPPKKDLSWTGLPEFVDDTVTDYRRPTPNIDASKCNKCELQSSTFSVFEHGESTSSIMSQPMIKFVKEADCPRVIKINNTKNARKSTVKYAEMYSNILKGPKVRGNQRNWNNLKSQQLGKDFLMQNKTCFKCGYFDHLASNCGVWVDNGKCNTPTHEGRKHNTDFYQIVDFLEASHTRYALTISPTIYVSHIRQFWSTARIETTDQETKIIATVDGKPQTISESSLRMHLKLNDEEGISSLPNAELFENLSLMGYNILLSPRVNIAKTSAMSHESSPRVPSLDADEGSMQQRLHELMELCTSLQRQQSQMADKIKDQDIKIFGLKARVKSPEDKESRREEPIQEDEMVNVLSSMEAANILSSGGAAFSTASISLADVFPTAGVLTVSAIFTTASVATPYTRRSRGITIESLQPMRIPIISAKDKGKQKVTQTEVPKKKKLQEQIDAQVAREVEEEFARENQRLSEQAARDYEIARIHAEEELKLMIEGLDRSNEVIAKHLSEYEQAEADLSVGEKI